MGDFGDETLSENSDHGDAQHMLSAVMVATASRGIFS